MIFCFNLFFLLPLIYSRKKEQQQKPNTKEKRSWNNAQRYPDGFCSKKLTKYTNKDIQSLVHTYIHTYIHIAGVYCLCRYMFVCVLEHVLIIKYVQKEALYDRYYLNLTTLTCTINISLSKAKAR